MPQQTTSVQDYQNLTFCVPKRGSDLYSDATSNLSRPVVVSSQVEGMGVGGIIPPNHVLLKVDRFGFSANNVTYGLLGEDPHFRYFEFHNAPNTNTTSSKTHGVIPVWGYATVVQSTHPRISVGERVFGYLGMSRYLLLPVDHDVNKYNFYVPRPHLPEDRRPYNQITRCAADPLYDPMREDELMIYRPLFWTSFWCEDWLHTTKVAKDTDGIIISSASAKTAYCLAFVLNLRRLYGKVALPAGADWTGTGGTAQPRIVGVTSKRNLEFTKSLRLYDEVFTYDQINELAKRGSRWVYVDVAGNKEFNNKVFKSFGSHIAKGVSLGMSHPSSSKENESFANSNSRLEMFFMPEWLAVRRTNTSVKEITQLQFAGWDALMRTCHQWIQIERVWWSGAAIWQDNVKEVIEAYEECVSGEIGPDRGLILSMWEKGQFDKTSQVKAKL